MKNSKGLKVFVIVAIVAVFLGGKKLLSKDKETSSASFEETLSLFNDLSNDSEYDDDSDDEYESGDSFTRLLSKSFAKNKGTVSKNTKGPYVAVIHISGVISPENKTYNQKWLLKKIKTVKNDPNNRGILLNINSPGGTVYESDETYLALLEYKNSTKRPVFAYFGALAASGGYYIGCAADTIYANRNCLTGSIGVIAGQTLDLTGLLDKMGIKSVTITAGKNKNMGNYNASLTEEQRAIMQSIADEAYEQFTGIVADSRDMPISEVKKLADGRIYTANQAKANGLVDSVCPYEDAKDDIWEYFAGEGEEPKEDVNFVDYKYRYEENLMSLFSGAASFAKNPEASVYELLGNSAGRCLYLYQ